MTKAVLGIAVTTKFTLKGYFPAQIPTTSWLPFALRDTWKVGLHPNRISMSNRDRQFAFSFYRFPFTNNTLRILHNEFSATIYDMPEDGRFRWYANFRSCKTDYFHSVCEFLCKSQFYLEDLFPFCKQRTENLNKVLKGSPLSGKSESCYDSLFLSKQEISVESES